MDRISRLVTERSPLAVGCLGISVAAGAIAATTRNPNPELAIPSVPWWLIQSLATGIILLSVAVFVSRFIRTYRYFAAVQGLIALLIVALVPSPLTLVLSITIPTLFTLGLYERFPANAVASIVLVVIIAVVRSGQIGVGLGETAIYLLSCGATVASLSLLSHYRERSLELADRVRFLEQNVTELTRANLVIQDYAREVQEDARDSERKRITRDIHDIVGYSFTNAMMMAEAAKFMALNEPEGIVAFLESLRSTIRDALDEVKRSLRELREEEQPPTPSKTALYLLIRVFSLSTGVTVRIEPGNTEWKRLVGIEYTLYHFVQEALINAFMHGGARNVTVMLWDAGCELQAHVVDDGSGASPVIKEGIGITGMRERALEVGGRIEVGPSGAGFTISMLVPLGEQRESED